MGKFQKIFDIYESFSLKPKSENYDIKGNLIFLNNLASDYTLLISNRLDPKSFIQKYKQTTER